jgi:hypothetical protein
MFTRTEAQLGGDFEIGAAGEVSAHPFYRLERSCSRAGGNSHQGLQFRTGSRKAATAGLNRRREQKVDVGGSPFRRRVASGFWSGERVAGGGWRAPWRRTRGSLGEPGVVQSKV